MYSMIVNKDKEYQTTKPLLQQTHCVCTSSFIYTPSLRGDGHLKVKMLGKVSPSAKVEWSWLH